MPETSKSACFCHKKGKNNGSFEVCEIKRGRRQDLGTEAGLGGGGSLEKV